MISKFTFASPAYFLLLAAVGCLVALGFLARRRKKTSVIYSDISLLEEIKRIRPSWKLRLRPGLFGLRTLALIALCLALARPQLGQSFEEILTEGVDIALVLDISGSMQAEDFKPKNRLFVAKEVIKEFIQGRKNDRIGLVVFAGKAFTKCPLTNDYSILLKLLEDVDFTTIEEDGTAIGMAVATSLNRLRDSHAKSKITILLTDGINNRGQIDPLTAAEMARVMGVKVYTIGVGTEGSAPFPVETILGKQYVYREVPLDEGVLKQMAEKTGGMYFRAFDPKSLESIYAEIGKMEKTEVVVKNYTRHTELFHYFLWSGLGLLLTEVFLGNTVFRKLP